MAKDPAFLFYSSDFMVGTQFFTHEQTGIYIRFLCAQHQHGRLSIDHMKIICGSYDFHSDVLKVVREKFVVDENGYFYNERLEKETGKRAAYSKSRGENRSKGLKKKVIGNESNFIDESITSSYDDHMKVISKSYENHMENENENINKEYSSNDSLKLKEDAQEIFVATGSMPGPDQIPIMKLPEVKAGSVIVMVRVTQKEDVGMKEVYDMWDVFKIQHFTGKKYYQDENAVHSHFINWAKTQKFNGNKSVTNGSKQPNGSGATGFNGKNAGFLIVAKNLRDELAVPYADGTESFGI